MNISGQTLLYCFVGQEGRIHTGTSFGGGGYGGTDGNNRGDGGGASDIRVQTDSLYARIIVAGAGGGSGNGAGGYGGGSTGGGQSGASGTQTAGGTGDRSGAFGVGGSFGTARYNGGGGGGWYGGGANNNSTGGGSGYVLTASSYKPSGYLLGAEYYLSNAQTIAGNQSFPAPGGGTETGHSGNGYARITLVE